MSKNKTPFKPDDVITWQRICEELIMPQLEAINTRLTKIEQAQKKEAVQVTPDKKARKDKNLIHIRIAARRYGLPSKWLREQAKKGRIPAIVADNQVLFDEDILAEWLANRAKLRAPIKRSTNDKKREK